MPKQIPQLKLRRSQPEQGKSVSVWVDGDDGNNYGMLLLPFEVWIKLQKLLQRGQESNAREHYPVQLKIVVEGYTPGKVKVKPLEATAMLPSLYREPVDASDIATPQQASEAQEEEDAEEELQKVLAEKSNAIPEHEDERFVDINGVDKVNVAAVEETLIRTLKLEVTQLKPEEEK